MYRLATIHFVTVRQTERGQCEEKYIVWTDIVIFTIARVAAATDKLCILFSFACDNFM